MGSSNMGGRRSVARKHSVEGVGTSVVYIDLESNPTLCIVDFTIGADSLWGGG